MRTLRYVKPAADGEHAGQVVLETVDGGEQFLLSVDVPLRDAVRADRAFLMGGPEPEPRIGPREIQVRVRGGESPQDLADAHSTSLEWIMRFATPVLAERRRIADEARRSRARRSTSEGQSVVFGEAVDERFAAQGFDPVSVRWDAHRREDGQWIVSAYWSDADCERVAEWAFQLAARTVAPADDTAADLLSDRPIQPLTPIAALEPDPIPAAGPRLVPSPDLADAHTGPLPALDDLFDQDAVAAEPDDVDGAVSARAADVAADAAADAARRAEPADDPDAPPLPLKLEAKPRASRRRSARLTNLGVAGREDEAKSPKSAREPVPSWDDILLGVRRKQD